MNNFDQSSTGLNITVAAFRDTDLSRFYFEDAFFTIKEGRKESLVYCEGNFSDFEKEYSFTLQEFKGALIDYMCDRYCSLVNLKDEVKRYTGSTWSKVKKEDLIDYAKNSLYNEENWIDFCEKSQFKPNFDIVISRGYCQGDYRKVIVPHKFWDIVGIPKPLDVQSNLSGYIDNLLWDCPIYCRFTVNEEEFFIDESLKNSYEWDKAEALEIAARLIKDRFTSAEQATIMDFLATTLKTDLDYQ